MIELWILWFVITITEGHLRHVPMEDAYPDQATCELDRPQLQHLIEEQFPDDQNLRTYCQPFRKDEVIHAPSHATL